MLQRPHLIHASSKYDAGYYVNICSEVLFLFESQCLQPPTQEVRAADDNVVVPANLHLIADVEVQKYAAHMLGLSSYPFPTCAGDCRLSHRCFACHTMVEDDKEGVLRARFSTHWTRWKAHMSLWRGSAEERVLAGLSAPVIRDVAGVRPYLMAAKDANVAFRYLEQMFFRAAGVDYRFHDVLRICERVGWYAELSAPCHYTQLTPQEFSPISRQLGWNASSSTTLLVV